MTTNIQITHSSEIKTYLKISTTIYGQVISHESEKISCKFNINIENN